MGIRVSTVISILCSHPDRAATNSSRRIVEEGPFEGYRKNDAFKKGLEHLQLRSTGTVSMIAIRSICCIQAPNEPIPNNPHH